MFVLVCACFAGCDKKKHSLSPPPFTLSVDNMELDGTVSDNFATISTIIVAGNSVSVTVGQFSTVVDTSNSSDFTIDASDSAEPPNTATINIEIR